MIDMDVLLQAHMAHMQITIDYTKASTGEAVTHTGGIYEIRGDRMFLWDTTLNDTIRQFIIGGITRLEVLAMPFTPTQGWPYKLNGTIIP